MGALSDSSRISIPVLMLIFLFLCATEQNRGTRSGEWARKLYVLSLKNWTLLFSLNLRKQIFNSHFILLINLAWHAGKEMAADALPKTTWIRFKN